MYNHLFIFKYHYESSFTLICDQAQDKIEDVLVSSLTSGTTVQVHH